MRRGPRAKSPAPIIPMTSGVRWLAPRQRSMAAAAIVYHRRLSTNPAPRRSASPSWSCLAGSFYGGTRRLSLANWCLRQAKSAHGRHLGTALLNCSEGAIASALVRNRAPVQVSLGGLVERSGGDDNQGCKGGAHAASLMPR